MTVAGVAYSALGMYPLAQLRAAWDDLYTAVAARAAGLGIDVQHGSAHSTGSNWAVTPRDSWLDANLVLGMTCGWPLVTALHQQVTVVGTFAYDLPVAGPAPHLYRSCIIARRDVPLAELASAGAAINSLDSLSGHISLLDAFDLGAMWPGDVILTGAHMMSIAAVRDGDADIASIDGMTWAFQQRDAPETLEGLVLVGHGPWVPCLPVILGAAADHADLAGWRAAICGALRDPSLATVCETLMLRDFVPADYADYASELAGLVARHT